MIPISSAITPTRPGGTPLPISRASGVWNLNALAVALTSLIGSDRLKEKLNTYESRFVRRYREMMRAKLGLERMEEGDDQLIGDLLALMIKAGADYTLSFRGLPEAGEGWLGLFGGRPRRGLCLARTLSAADGGRR